MGSKTGSYQSLMPSIILFLISMKDGRRVTVSGQDVLADKAGTLAKIDGTKKWKKPRFKPRSKEPAVFSPA